ncbi:MAG: motility protein A [Bacteroidota bacterium]
MERSTLIGLGSGFALIAIAILVQGGLSSFLSIESLLIVVGGVFAATLVNYSVEDITTSYQAIQSVVGRPSIDLTEDIELMTMFSRRARRQGLLTLDDDVRYVEDRYLKNGLELVIDGIPEENLVQILDDEIKALERRHTTSINVLNSMGTYSPAFGMIGTLIGLILMLRNLDNPEGIGPGLAIALITTFYGTILSNLVFIPLGGKLDKLSEQEKNEKEMMRTGLLSLANGENPRIMEKKMLTYVSPEERAKYIRIHGDRGFSKKQEQQMYNHWVAEQKEKWENVVSTM